MTSTSSNAPSTAFPPVSLIRQITAYRTSQCIRVAVELGIPELLRTGPQSAQELAAQIDANPDFLNRLLNHLVNEGIFQTDEEQKFHPTSTSSFLCADNPHSLKHWVSCELNPLYWRAWEKLDDQLRSEKTAFELTYEMRFFEQLSEDTKAQKRFDEQMQDAASGMGSVIAQFMSFEPATSIMDIGGGNGTFLAKLLEQNPGTTGILFDLSREDENLNAAFMQNIEQKRAKVERGSFFESVPEGADAYIFSRVFHDFDDAAVLEILKKTRESLKGHERLYLIEIISDTPDISHTGTSQDIFMMTLLGGRERTKTEYETLLSESGFETVQITPTPIPLSILEFRVK